MDDDQIIGFSWPGFFLVSSFSCFLFTFFLWLMDGTLSKLFLSLGGLTLLLSVICWVVGHLQRRRKNNGDMNPGVLD